MAAEDTTGKGPLARDRLTFLYRGSTFTNAGNWQKPGSVHIVTAGGSNKNITTRVRNGGCRQTLAIRHHMS